MEVENDDDDNKVEGDEDVDIDDVEWATRGISLTASEEAANRALQRAGADGRHFVWVLLEEDARAYVPPREYIIAFFCCLESGKTILYHPVLKEFRRLLRISPMQLSPNFWALYTSMHVIWHKCFGVDLTVKELCFVYQLKNLPN